MIMTTKIERRIKIKYRVRNKISGTTECPRMSVFDLNSSFYFCCHNNINLNDYLAPADLPDFLRISSPTNLIQMCIRDSV